MQIHLYTPQMAGLIYASISVIKSQLSKTLKLELMIPSSNDGARINIRLYPVKVISTIAQDESLKPKGSKNNMYFNYSF